jgi:hypothetical protein
MEIIQIEKVFREKVSREISLFEEGIDRYRISSPFHFDDGDMFVVVLKKSGETWILSDEGHTFMHLSYILDIDTLEKGTRAKIISTTLDLAGIRENSGVLYAYVTEENIGNVFYSYIQALIRITDVNFLSRERVKSTFLEDFKIYLEEKVPIDRIAFCYNDKQHDPTGKYPVDCRINHMQRPLFIFAINSDDKCNISTINLLQYEKWGLEFRSLAIFEDQEEISRKVLSRFSDVCEKQFSSLISNKERIEKYLQENI